MGHCEKNHSACKPRVNPGLPLRLLRMILSKDRVEGPRSLHVRLEETNSIRAYRYVALSHCWAHSKPLTTTRTNLLEHTICVPWDQLSPAIRQAVILAFALGFEYIWIDSLCIIQMDLADWESELPRMDMIYGNASVVFAAHGPELGLEKVPLQPIRDSKRLEDAPVYCRQKIDHHALFSAPMSTSSLFGRAWCMQERIFARRILHFGGFCEEVFFECNTGTRCECSRIRKSSLSSKSADQTLKAQVTATLATIKEQNNSLTASNELWETYIKTCEDYTARGITFATDTLPAVSSLMSTFAPYLGNYHAGLWEHNLLLSLQWEALDSRECSRHNIFVAPSLSWASRSGPVIWYMDSSKTPTEETHDFAIIIDVACTLAGKDPFGKISGGHITLRGHTTKIAIASTTLLAPDGRLKMAKEGAKECYVTLDSREDIETVRTGTLLLCLDIMRDKNGLHNSYVSSLILLPVESQSNCYRRVGFSTMLAEHFTDASLEEITVV